MVNQKFTNPLDDLSEYEQDNIKKLLGYFYDSAINHINNEKDEAFFVLRMRSFPDSFRNF